MGMKKESEFGKFTELVDRMVAPKKPDAQEPRRIPKANKKTKIGTNVKKSKSQASLCMNSPNSTELYCGLFPSLRKFTHERRIHN